MRVLLINPPRIKSEMPTLRDEICFQDVIYTPFPIRLAQLAGVLLAKFPGIELKVIDANAMGVSIKELEDILPVADVMIFQYRDWETDRKSTRLNSSHSGESRMPSSA